ncbi:carotenoid 9,10(9',10')-cleavage dioxygenase 1 [Vitis vinifera]|nr:carotenoid 9,10(9',10')-cleavage dioxygenase 1 [Vitis vinifera]|eukprot:XP_010648499.1 PREDICTED: carotenoid 9,10(9',10')-cleavage dioxygenase 1 [Vitis vinifera]
MRDQYALISWQKPKGLNLSNRRRRLDPEMASFSFALQVNGLFHNHSISHSFDHLKTFLSSAVKKISVRTDIAKTLKNTSNRMLDAFVDSTFQFVSQPLLPSQKNFAPVEEIGEAVQVVCIEGIIPVDFRAGVYIRNGSNPLFGGLKYTISIFGRSSHIWVEGEGMLHAIYFMKDAHGDWIISYKNRYVESETFKLEKQRNKPSFLPTVEGDSPAIIAAYLLNMLRFGMVNKQISSTSIFEHSRKFYAITENHLPQEIDIFTLETLEEWDVNGAWDRPFTSHPKKAPGTGELVTIGMDGQKPFIVAGVISADGNMLSHKVDLKFNRATLIHEIGVTQKYNVIMDCPLTVDMNRLVAGGPLIKYDKEGYTRIGVMPRYGNADSVKWFDVEANCTLHILNSFEDGNEVVVRGCRALESIIPGPDQGLNKFEWFSMGFKPIEISNKNSNGFTQEGFLFARVYEWRLNMETGEVKERNLTGTDVSMEFPMINEDFTGVKHKYGYTQVLDSMASSSCGMAKYGGLAKLYFEEQDKTLPARDGKKGQLIKVEYHRFEENNFCSGSAFVPKQGGVEEDDGWIISFVHNEDTNISQVHIIDARKFDSKPVAKITLPQRVPYGFHGTFIPMPGQA